jgi:hypothetical protein
MNIVIKNRSWTADGNIPTGEVQGINYQFNQRLITRYLMLYPRQFHCTKWLTWNLHSILLSPSFAGLDASPFCLRYTRYAPPAQHHHSKEREPPVFMNRRRSDDSSTVANAIASVSAYKGDPYKTSKQISSHLFFDFSKYCLKYHPEVVLEFYKCLLKSLFSSFLPH